MTHIRDTPQSCFLTQRLSAAQLPGCSKTAKPAEGPWKHESPETGALQHSGVPHSQSRKLPLVVIAFYVTTCLFLRGSRTVKTKIAGAGWGGGGGEETLESGGLSERRAARRSDGIDFAGALAKARRRYTSKKRYTVRRRTQSGRRAARQIRRRKRPSTLNRRNKRWKPRSAFGDVLKQAGTTK